MNEGTSNSRSSSPNSIPWLGLLVTIALTVVTIFLINRVVPPNDRCTSDLIAQTKGLEFSLGTKLGDAGAKVSPAAQSELSERLQEYAQTTALLCRMNASGALSDANYATQVSQINSQLGALRNAGLNGGFASASRADIAQVIFDALSQQAIGPFIVFFEWTASTITPEALQIIDSAARACSQTRARGANLVMNVAGYGADGESDSEKIATNRLISVVEEMNNRGCDVPATISIHSPARDSDPIRITPVDGFRGLENRRVEITFSPAVI
jgi:outer membrane protein OmpA-like peptidoglycan-associated protein